jgi:hypothetical protein
MMMMRISMVIPMVGEKQIMELVLWEMDVMELRRVSWEMKLVVMEKIIDRLMDQLLFHLLINYNEKYIEEIIVP